MKVNDSWTAFCMKNKENSGAPWKAALMMEFYPDLLLFLHFSVFC